MAISILGLAPAPAEYIRVCSCVCSSPSVPVRVIDDSKRAPSTATLPPAFAVTVTVKLTEAGAVFAGSGACRTTPGTIHRRADREGQGVRRADLRRYSCRWGDEADDDRSPRLGALRLQSGETEGCR